MPHARMRSSTSRGPTSGLSTSTQSIWFTPVTWTDFMVAS